MALLAKLRSLFKGESQQTQGNSTPTPTILESFVATIEELSIALVDDVETLVAKLKLDDDTLVPVILPSKFEQFSEVPYNALEAGKKLYVSIANDISAHGIPYSVVGKIENVPDNSTHHEPIYFEAAHS